MAKKNKKFSLLGIIVILVVCLFVCAVFCVGILILAPNISIFGISWRTVINSTTSITEVNETLMNSSFYSSIDEVRVVANKHSVYVHNNFDSENVTFLIEGKSSYAGFYKVNSVKNKNALFKITTRTGYSEKLFSDEITIDEGVDTSGKNKILFIEVNTPKGLAFKNSGSLHLNVPSGYTKAINIDSKKLINMGVSDSLEGIESGSLKFTNVNLTTKNEEVTITNKVKLSGDCTITTERGNIDYSAKSDGLNKLKINTSHGKFKYSSTNSIGELVISSDNGVFTLNTLNGNLTLEKAIGSLTADLVNGNITTAVLEVNESDPSKSKYYTPKLEMKIKRVTGNVELKKIDADFIELNECEGNVSVNNVGGYVYIGAGSNSNREMNLESSSKITVCGGCSKIKATASRDVVLKEVCGELELQSKKGKVTGTITNFAGESVVSAQGDVVLSLGKNKKFMLKVTGNMNITYPQQIEADTKCGYDFYVNYTAEEVEEDKKKVATDEIYVPQSDTLKISTNSKVTLNELN